MSDGYGVTIFPLYKHPDGRATWQEIRENAARFMAPFKKTTKKTSIRKKNRKSVDG